MIYFLQGLTMGLAYVAPIGLQNLFVINTALTQKRSRAYITALIVIFFDVTLAFGCFYGIGAVMNQSHLIEKAVLLIGSIIVAIIGIQLLRSKADMKSETNVNVSLLKAVSIACVVTWFNPQALIDGTMMLGAFRATLPPEGTTKFIIGVATASVSWFFGITTVISLFSAKFNDKTLRVINIVCGTVIIGYGVKLFVNFIQLVI